MGLTFAQGDRAPSRALRAAPTGIRRACDRYVRCLVVRLAVALLIGVSSSSLADTELRDPVIVLPHGVVLPVPARPPSNADPMNPASPGDVVTQRYNNLRTGTTTHGGLDQRSVSSGRFGFIGILGSKDPNHNDKTDPNYIDGVVLAQPLFMEKVRVNGRERSVVFIATSTNMVYAFDADKLDKLWEHSLGRPFSISTADDVHGCTGQMAVTQQDTEQPPPAIASDGIQSTPVIDFARSRIIVSYRSMDRVFKPSDTPFAEPANAGMQRIVALNLEDGKRATLGPGGPILDKRVEDNDPFGTGPVSNSEWNLVHRNRASLLLDGDHVYVAFAGRCEEPEWPHKELSFQGWIYVFDAETLTLRGRYRSTRQPNGSASPLGAFRDPIAGGGIWQASTGLATDGRGSLYFSTGNQSHGSQPITQPADASGRNLPDSIVRLRIDNIPGVMSMTPTDWFTPYRKGWLDLQDLDLGSAGVVLIPNTRYLAAAGKESMLYVLDRNNLGKFDDSAPAPDPGREGTPFTSQDEFGLDDPRRDHVVQKFRIGENQYCAATDPNPVFCLGPIKNYPQDGLTHRGVDTKNWFPWPHIHGTPVFGAFPDGRGFLYVWPEKDFLKSFRWRGKRFETQPTIATRLGSGEAPASPDVSHCFASDRCPLAPPYIANVPGTDLKLRAVGMPGGFLSLAIDPAQPAAGVLFASVQRCRVNNEDPDFHECSVEECRRDLTPQFSRCGVQHWGMLRAFDPISLRELWNNQIDPFADKAHKNYFFAKFVPPTIAHGRVFLPTGSQFVLVYGLR